MKAPKLKGFEEAHVYSGYTYYFTMAIYTGDVFFKKPNNVRLCSKSNVNEMLKDFKGYGWLAIYVVVPSHTTYLPQNHTKNQCLKSQRVVPVIKGVNVPQTVATSQRLMWMKVIWSKVNIGDCVPENVEAAWSQFEETLTYEVGVGTSQLDQYEENSEMGEEEPDDRMKDETEG